MVGIQTLPTEVVNLIAAGEVIDSLAAVVRELVENSLDAGATRIVVSVCSDQWRVRVADNGSGMNLGDLQLAASAHSTSKIRNSDDLWKITSLGFRGEALHSLAALAQVEILSRLRERLMVGEWLMTPKVNQCRWMLPRSQQVQLLLSLIYLVLGPCVARDCQPLLNNYERYKQRFTKLLYAIPTLLGKYSKMTVPGLPSVLVLQPNKFYLKSSSKCGRVTCSN
jgi:hypothetical protein